MVSDVFGVGVRAAVVVVAGTVAFVLVSLLALVGVGVGGVQVVAVGAVVFVQELEEGYARGGGRGKGGERVVG